MTVDFYYKLMLFILNKSQSGGNLSPDDFNRTINMAQNSYVAYLTGTFQSYQLGRPIAKTELGQNSVVRQRLSPVIYGCNLHVDSTGFSPYPGDYLQTDAMWTLYNYNRIRYCDGDKWWANYNSKIDPPLYTKPIYRLRDTGFEFAPTNIVMAKVDYVRVPPEIVWGYSLDSVGRPVYDAALSADPIWDSVSALEIISRALQQVGVNLQFGQVQQYAKDIKDISGQ